MDFNSQVLQNVNEIENIIKKYLPKEEGYQEIIFQAMNYSLMAGGKRVRPMLMQETYRMFGGKSQVIEPFMAAMEMIHTYSLVHDDLPAMDNDEYRIGRKTTHVLYGEAMGILAGDALLNFAFETATGAFAYDMNHEPVIKSLKILAKNAGVFGMIGGQVVDVQNENTPLSLDQLNFIYELKTGALIEASMLIGAVLAGATAAEQQIVSRVAKKVGLAFQIQDDILDVISTKEVLGKPIGSDEKNHKTTYVTLKGLEAAKKEVEIISNEAVREFDSLVVKNEFLRGLIIHLITREK